jgi:hypothetical protein
MVATRRRTTPGSTVTNQGPARSSEASKVFGAISTREFGPWLHPNFKLPSIAYGLMANQSTQAQPTTRPLSVAFRREPSDVGFVSESSLLINAGSGTGLRQWLFEPVPAALMMRTKICFEGHNMTADQHPP